MSSFGSTIFTFNFSLNHPWITAHVSVLLLEEAQDEGDTTAPMQLTEDEQDVGDLNTPKPTVGMQLGMVPSTSAVNANPIAPAPPELNDNAVAQAQDLNAGGWCRIMEEAPDE